MQRMLRKMAFTAGLAVLLVWSLFPLWFAVVSSFSTDTQLYQPHYWPPSEYLGNYIDLFHRTRLPRGMVNSLTVGIAALAATLTLVREPLTKPVKEEEDAQAREVDFDRFFAELLNALGLDQNGTLPAWWQGWPAKTHVRRWRDDLGLSEDRIIETATESRRDHPAPPDGPKALDRAMEHAAQRDAQSAPASHKTPTGKRQPNRTGDTTRPSADELAAFYADMVNSDRFLPTNTVSNTIRDAMLSRGLVTPERLRARGVH